MDLNKKANELKEKEIKKLQEKLPEIEEYHCICDNCNFAWYDNHDYDENTYCWRCGSGEVYVYGKDDDNF